MKRLFHAAAVLSLSLTFATLALADMIPEPPASCPRGAYGVSSHQGSWCAPNAECKGDESCETEGAEGERLRCGPAVGICVEVTRVRCEGKYRDPKECFITMQEVHGNCEAQSDCKLGTCRLAKRCVKGWSLAFTLTLSVCGLVAVFAVGLLGWAIIRRRSSSPAQ